jgi:homopolymeric O-antigen transport system ATP-binding protein
MIAVEARNLTKIYRIYQSPVQRLKEICFRKSYHSDFVALRDINFSVPTGGTFGIIGENGAGKSTLLKILANTLKPTSGDLSINGRTAALLELGAGFNPELTGEENIYLNAYLMGLSKAEIDAKKAEIISFSELGQSITRPVKTYSSGMHVRLAFSIATSVDPEILIIDEALSVGDEYFQKKCIDRMMSFREKGKTIIFCSHSMYFVQQLCKRALWIHGGAMQSIGEAGKIIMEYQNYERGKMGALKTNVSDLSSNSDDSEKLVRITDVKILDKNASNVDTVRTFDPVMFSFRIRCTRQGLMGHVGFSIIRNDEVMTFGTMSKFDGKDPVSLDDGKEFLIAIPSLKLLSGIYDVFLVVADEFALHPYDFSRTKAFTVVSPGKELGMHYVEHIWAIDGDSPGAG